MASHSNNSNSTPSHANSPYPEGFYGVEAPERTQFWDGPPSNFTPEMNFNNYIYFLSNDGVFRHGSEFDLDTLRSVIGRPHGGPWLPQLDKLMTLDSDLVKRPAHLPNIMDIVGLPEVQLALDNTKVGEAADDDDHYGDGERPLFPALLEDKADATPVLPDEGPIYWFGKRSFSSKVAFNADALQVLQIKTPMSAVAVDVKHQPLVEDYLNSRYYELSLSPMKAATHNLVIGSTIILWNVRRITRPSFEINFEKYVRMFNPVVMILTEVRVFSIACKRIIDRLDTPMKWWLDGAVGLMGGMLVMWDPSRASIDMAAKENTAQYGTGKRHVTGFIKGANADGSGANADAATTSGADADAVADITGC